MDEERIEAMRKGLEEEVPGLPIYLYGPSFAVLWRDAAKYFGLDRATPEKYLHRELHYTLLRGVAAEEFRLRNPGIKRFGMAYIVFVLGLRKLKYEYMGRALRIKARTEKEQANKPAPVKTHEPISKNTIPPGHRNFGVFSDPPVTIPVGLASRPVVHPRYREVKQLKGKLKVLLFYTKVFVRQQAHSLKGKRLEANRRLGKAIGEVLVDFFTQLNKLQTTK